MGLNKDEEALRVADEIFKQILMFRQYGAPAGISPKNAQKKLDVMVEHFVRRDEPESAYYETLGDHSEYEFVRPLDEQMKLCGCGTEPDIEIIHRLDGLCYFIDSEFEDDPSLKALGQEFKEN